MEAQDLSPEEQEIVKRFRGLSEAKRAATLASENAFISFLKSIKEVWEKVAAYAREIWNWFRSIF